MTLRILIADDHAILREGLAALIEAQEDMSVVAAVGDASAALESVRDSKPDVAVVDISMPGGGLHAAQQISATHPATRVLMLTMHDEASYRERAMAAGASGFVEKKSAGSELIGAIRDVSAGRLAPHVSWPAAPDDATTAAAGQGTEPLSQREGQVLELLARGYTNKEIASRLSLAKQTVDTYRVRLQDKLGLKGRAALVDFALEAGILRSRSAP